MMRMLLSGPRRLRLRIHLASSMSLLVDQKPLSEGQRIGGNRIKYNGQSRRGRQSTTVADIWYGNSMTRVTKFRSSSPSLGKVQR